MILQSPRKHQHVYSFGPRFLKNKGMHMKILYKRKFWRVSNLAILNKNLLFQRIQYLADQVDAGDKFWWVNILKLKKKILLKCVFCYLLFQTYYLPFLPYCLLIGCMDTHTHMYVFLVKQALHTYTLCLFQVTRLHEHPGH